MRRCHLCLLGVVLALGGCSEKRIRADDLKSEVQHARQLARECSQLIELRQGGRVTQNFRRTHEHYLLKQGEELKKDIQDKSVDSSLQQPFAAYKEKLAFLTEALMKLESDPQKESFDAIDRDLRQLEEQL